MREMISVASGFQYSVNISYDLGNDDKLRNFIPTKSALNLLEDILLSTNPSSSDRSRVLIGAYGKGKSHIVLTILSILLKKPLDTFERLMPKIEENPRLCQLVQNYYDSDNRILPVVISGSNTSLTQAFLLSLQRTLSENGLLSVMPETNYQAAVSVIKRWETEFPETYHKFEGMINTPVAVLIDRLTNYDVVAYEAFEKAYPSLTAGSQFNPFLGFDVVDLYESVAKGLQSAGFTGIYVVYDEFSKFLEANIVDASVSDTKMLQDFAEKCNRSGALQLHLMLISHKEISNYIDNLPKEKVDGWRGVSERFKHVRMSNNFSQTYEIISAVIRHHEPLWTEYCEDHALDFQTLYTRYEKHQMFIDATGEINTAIRGCFPLHPVSTFILPRLSERVAQNERTLFTFLSADGTSTLPNFIDSNDHIHFHLVTPDRIYDYFEPLFRKEVYAGDIHETYVLTSNILNKLEDGSLESKIVKTISLIYILEQFERLSPTKEQIIGIFSCEYAVEAIETAIHNLIEKEFVVYLKRSNDYLRLKQSSGVDIHQKIHDEIEHLKGRVAARDILNRANFDNYLYPARYNDEREMTRYFSFQFISSREIDTLIDWNIKSSLIKGDGVIYGIIPENDTELSRVQQIIAETSRDAPLSIFILPRSYHAIDNVVLEYEAVSNLREQITDDSVLFDEYEVVFEDVEEIIKNYIGSFTHPESYATQFYYQGERLEIHRKAALTELMSAICDKVFSDTPIINNEAINKEEITSIAATSRNKLIVALLRNELEPNLGLTGTGQEVSIMRSTLIRTGIWTEQNGMPEINLYPTDANMRNMLSVIEQFIEEVGHDGKKSFGVLYNRLMAPNYHIGLRKGVIPLYLAVVLHKYRQQIIILDHSRQIPVSLDALLQVNAAPDKYSLEYLEWDEEKENYIRILSEVFSEYVIDAEKKSSTYDFISNAMRRWFMALPKYAKERKIKPNGDKIPKQQLDMIKLLRQNISGNDLLFKRIPATFAFEEFSADVAEDIVITKRLFDNLLPELKKCLIEETKALFIAESKQIDINRISLTSAVKEWCESLDPKSFEQLFTDGTERFLQLLSNVTNDEDLFISRLAKLATGLRLEDWDNQTTDRFLSRIREYKVTADAFHSEAVAATINDTSSYQVTFADEGGATTRRFDRVEVSPRGKLLFNQITFALENMGHSISEQEKRQVLMEVLKKIC